MLRVRNDVRVLHVQGLRWSDMDWHFTIIGVLLPGTTLHDVAYKTISINRSGLVSRWVAMRMS